MEKQETHNADKAFDALVSVLAAKKQIDPESARLNAIELLIQDGEPIDVFGEWEWYCYQNRMPDTLENVDDRRAFEALTENRDCIIIRQGYRDGRRTLPLAFDAAGINVLTEWLKK